MAQRAGIAQKHADLTVVHRARRPAVLASDASRVAALFQKAGFVEHQDRLRIPQMLQNIAAQLIADGLGVPQRPAQQVLEAIGRGIPADLGQLPVVLALGRTQQAAQIGHGPLPRLRMLEIGC
jgi:hypothetical protein